MTTLDAHNDKLIAVSKTAEAMVKDEFSSAIIQYTPGTGVMRAITSELRSNKIEGMIFETASMHQPIMFRAEMKFDPINFIKVVEKVKDEFLILYVDDIALTAPEFNSIIAAMMERSVVSVRSHNVNLEFKFSGKIILLAKKADRIAESLLLRTVLIDATM